MSERLHATGKYSKQKKPYRKTTTSMEVLAGSPDEVREYVLAAASAEDAEVDEELLSELIFQATSRRPTDADIVALREEARRTLHGKEGGVGVGVGASAPAVAGPADHAASASASAPPPPPPLQLQLPADFLRYFRKATTQGESAVTDADLYLAQEGALALPAEDLARWQVAWEESVERRRELKRRILADGYDLQTLPLMRTDANRTCAKSVRAITQNARMLIEGSTRRGGESKRGRSRATRGSTKKK